MRVRIALLCLFASLLSGAAFAAPGTPAASLAQVASAAPGPSAPAFLLPEGGGADGFLWLTPACDFKLNRCLSHCNGEVDCQILCDCAWYSCNGLPLPSGC